LVSWRIGELKTYPALDVRSGSHDLLLALVDDFSPTAVEERRESVRVFFATADARAAAGRALAARGYAVEALDVDDEDWARRSQASLEPITIGQITIFPNPQSRIPNPGTIAIVIQPSMGFGTGHHATTRLCLAALQTIDLTGRTVLDVGTGSGVLAIAAARLGAAHAVGLDNDPDAIQSAIENLVLNPDAPDVEFHIAELTGAVLPPADVVTANLTGALLARTSQLLLTALQPGGTLVASGILAEERDGVLRAFAGTADAGPEDLAGPNKARPTYAGPPYVGRTLLGPPAISEEGGWVAMVLKKR
jgi:ribosomal protein L11 methyltransferase